MFFRKLPETVAAIDLGSNSFHMIVAKIENGQIHVVDKIKEMVRLGGGLDKNGNLTEEAQERALACLSRFGERLSSLPRGAVRAVGTNTLRKARNSHHFLPLAQQALGHPIEIVAGREEARLIYLGVAHSLAASTERRLVMDIGGGSTEYIIGTEFDPIMMESLHMGCVSMTQRYFSDGEINEKNWKAAVMHARRELRSIRRDYLDMGWEQSVGASGTLLAISRVLREQGWSSEGITLKGLSKLRKTMMEIGKIDKLALKGLGEDRAPVFVGGVAIVQATFEALKIDLMVPSDGALREGIIYDMLGRSGDEDVRGRTIDTLASRYHIDQLQAQRVTVTAMKLFNAVADEWGLDGDHGNLLDWAASLHEIGRVIAHNQYHKHGAYMLEHSDLGGFSLQEQLRLATLVRAHRRKFPIKIFQQYDSSEFQTMVRLAILLRLAVLFHRNRDERELPLLSVEAKDNGLYLEFSEGWLKENGLTKADLKSERKLLQTFDFNLEF
ncbi:MAG: exopolyphosphatase [Gammaproteobacteria bacterium]|nr:exopolyphosphatase [Gammaproteobacteria bacterium]